MRIVEYDPYPTCSLYTVEIASDKCVTVKHRQDTGLTYIMQNEDGSEVYDPTTGNCFPHFGYDKVEALEMVRSAELIRKGGLYTREKRIYNTITMNPGLTTHEVALRANCYTWEVHNAARSLRPLGFIYDVVQNPESPTPSHKWYPGIQKGE